MRRVHPYRFVPQTSGLADPSAASPSGSGTPPPEPLFCAQMSVSPPAGEGVAKNINLLPHEAELVGAGLACRRGHRLVFAGLDCRLPSGGALVLTGSNGSGKSSLLRLLATLLSPAAGELSWDGAPVRCDTARY